MLLSMPSLKQHIMNQSLIVSRVDRLRVGRAQSCVPWSIARYPLFQKLVACIHCLVIFSEELNLIPGDDSIHISSE